MEALKPKKEALSVSAALTIAKSLLQEHTFKILGEVSELNDKPGYKAVYFTIKDDKATLPCLIWKSRYQASEAKLHIGAKVEVTGRFSIFPAKGRMNFDVSFIVLAGEGDLRLKVAQLAQKLKGEGLMDPSAKLSLPNYPTKIGLVTSPRGAAVFDVLRTLRRRFPMAEILFAGVPVEGNQAAANLVNALNVVALAKPEVILLVRGGGSFEDLMPFNDELLARTIASLPIPVVTGIGHEPDTSIADMVADVRASTPTAAAESVAPQISEINDSLFQAKKRISNALLHRISRSSVYLDSIASRPSLNDPFTLFESDLQMVDHFRNRIEFLLKDALIPKKTAVNQLEICFARALPHSFEKKQLDLKQLERSLDKVGKTILIDKNSEVMYRMRYFSQIGKTLLNSRINNAALMASRLNDLSPLKTLERGWSIATDAQGHVIKSVDQVGVGADVSIQVKDGEILCQVKESNESKLFEFVSLEE